MAWLGTGLGTDSIDPPSSRRPTRDRLGRWSNPVRYFALIIPGQKKSVVLFPDFPTCIDRPDPEEGLRVARRELLQRIAMLRWPGASIAPPMTARAITNSSTTPIPLSQSSLCQNQRRGACRRPASCGRTLAMDKPGPVRHVVTDGPSRAYQPLRPGWFACRGVGSRAGRISPRADPERQGRGV